MLSLYDVKILARAGGGGSGGGGGAGGIIYLPFLIAAMILAWWRRKKQIKKAEQDVEVAEARDPEWSKSLILTRASDVFYQYQKDWSSFNLSSMDQYLTEPYLKHMSLVMLAMKQLNRQNDVRSPQLLKATLFNVNDSQVNSQDSFDVEMKGVADDNLIDLATNKLLWKSNDKFTEIWHFDRMGERWMLDDIEQTNAETAIEKGYTPKDEIAKEDDRAAKMESFATSQNFYYNADFGWLLLPDKGLLFGAAAFGKSDVNYHVIGLYNDILVQFYEYVPFPNSQRRLRDYFISFYKPYYQITNYTIAQTVLPKDYGDIIVQHKSKYGIRFTPSGMKKVVLEWPEFNQRYSVFATDTDKINSLELLNPSFMEQIFALPYVVNIQITGNNLYLFSADPKADFDTMLNILKVAFNQMKM